MSSYYALRDSSGRTYGVFPTRAQAETWRAAHRNPDELRIETIPK